MKYEVYSELIITDDFSVIDFISIGKNGAIPKRIAFTATELDNVYNLAFGDINEDGEIDDYTISDNGDRNKILATIVNVVDDYTKKFPELNEKLFNFTIMKKKIKQKSDLFKKEITYTVDENLNKLKGKVLAPKKLAEANKLLKKLKTPLPS